MYEIYCKLRDELGLKDADVSKATGITKSTFSDWKNGRSKPKDEKLLKIATFFGVTLDYLRTGTMSEDEHIKNMTENSKLLAIEQFLSGFDDECVEHFKNYTKLSPDNRKKVDFYMSNILSLQELEEKTEQILAAHERTDIVKNADDIKDDLSVFDDGNWE